MFESKSYAGTKRRAHDLQSTVKSYIGRDAAVLTRRVNRLAKKMKINNPTHLAIFSLPGTFPSISTTGTIFDIASFIAQGNNYTDRIGAKILMTHLNLKGVLAPGSTATNPCPTRITVFRAETGVAFAANMNGTYSPIATNTSLQVYFDKFYTVAGTTATAGFPTSINISLKLKHYQKFGGTGAGSQVGESIYVLVQSSNLTGTTAPLITGVMELFFQPM